MTIGIYEIYNETNGKRYIGQTKDAKQRKRQHFYELRHNIHKSKVLQEDYNKGHSLAFRIIRECSLDCINDLEKEYIKKYRTTEKEFGYNLELGGTKGRTLNEETKRKIAESHKGNKYMVGKKLTDEWKKHLSEAQPHRKRILCIETGVVYESFADAARKTGLIRTKIVSCCTGKRNKTGGYHFAYADTRPGY